MATKQSPPKTPFDNLVSSTKLDILKLLIPFVPVANQSQLALYIKFQELIETMHIFRLFPNGIRSCDLANNENTTDNPDFISLMKPYLPEENIQMIDNISNMMNMMELIKQMQVMSSTNEDDSSTNHSMDFLKNILSPEQQAMFDMMNTMYDTPDSTDTSDTPDFTDTPDSTVSSFSQDEST